MKKIWKMVRKNNGKKAKIPLEITSKQMIKHVKQKKEIADVLEETFQQSSSSANYNKSFQNQKKKKKKKKKKMKKKNTL